MADTQQPESGSLETVEIKMDRALCDRLSQEALKHGASFSQLVCEVMVDWLGSKEKGQKSE